MCEWTTGLIGQRKSDGQRDSGWHVFPKAPTDLAPDVIPGRPREGRRGGVAIELTEWLLEDRTIGDVSGDNKPL